MDGIYVKIIFENRIRWDFGRKFIANYIKGRKTYTTSTQVAFHEDNTFTNTLLI